MDLTYNVCTLSPDPGTGENCRRLTGSDGKASAYSVGDPRLIPGSGRSPGEGHGNPLQYSCLENPIDGGACWATVHGVTKSRTRLSDFAFTYLRAGLGPRRSTNHRVTRVTQGRLSFLCTHKHLLFHSQHLTHIPCADHSPETVWLNRGP